MRVYGQNKTFYPTPAYHNNTDFEYAVWNKMIFIWFALEFLHM
jgi:hypothetical protein